MFRVSEMHDHNWNAPFKPLYCCSVVCCICSLCPCETSLHRVSSFQLRSESFSLHLRCFSFSLTTLFQSALEGTDQSQGSRAVLKTGTESFLGPSFILWPVHISCGFSVMHLFKTKWKGKKCSYDHSQLARLDRSARGKAISLIKSLQLWSYEYGICLLLYCIHTFGKTPDLNGLYCISPLPLVIARVALLTVVQIFSMIVWVQRSIKLGILVSHSNVTRQCCLLCPFKCFNFYIFGALKLNLPPGLKSNKKNVFVS